ncbi:Ldh family oxidoreductase [Brevibacillus nitrificans]|uniref:Ldh family oxidoreductase n=1 Tax=Brevibacillus nitrificans TaxID=651560 RepID=UPI002866AD19|nr:Ldh family oxidoreductase [Brevibacillus nitrificans]MDR7316355.1 LDH2 family malate/lactate/ureidoglycolate dehydrogenase [Brevibacillus nitrificans]
MNSIRYDWKRLEEVAAELFEKVGVSERHAQTVAQSLVHADLRGIESHGLSRLPIYLSRIKAGVLSLREAPEIVRQDGAAALVDGKNQLGAVIGQTALELAMSLARQTGIGFVGVRHSNHFGSCSFYAEKAIEKGLILLVLSNAPESMAPTGGIRPFFGTNPIAIGIPAGQEAPFLLDMATSVVARGKIALAAKKGEQIPEDWAIDPDGNPTTDPQRALLGSLLPIGGAKGYGLAMFIDILCGLLTGAASGPAVQSLYDNWTHPQNIGHVFLTIDIQRFWPLTVFQSRMDEYIREIKSVPKRAGIEEILIPGEIERRKMIEQQANGVKLSAAIAQELEQLCVEYGVDWSKVKIHD